MPNRSFVRQTLLFVSVVLAAAMTVYGWLAALQQERVYETLLGQEIEITARNLSELCAHHLLLEDYADMEHLLLHAADYPDVRLIRVCEPDGHLLININRPPGSKAKVRYESSPHLSPPPELTLQHGFDRAKREYTVWHPIRAGQLLGWLQISMGMDSVSPLRRAVWISTALLGVLLVTAGVLVLLLTLKPSLHAIRQLAEFARTLNSRKGETVAIRSPAREILDLAAALNFASRELRTSEDSLLQERERLAVIIRSIGDGVIACDLEGRIVLMNEAAKKLTTCTEPTGRHLIEVLNVAEGDRDRISALPGMAMAMALGQPPNEVQVLLPRPAGDARTVLLNIAPLLDAVGKPTGMVTVLRDLTTQMQMEADKQHLETQLRQAQKMEAIGTMAGGIAHDFNNILTAISGYAELTQLDLAADSKPWQNLQAVRAACGRARDLINQILTFSRKGDQEQLPIQMHFLVKEALKLLRSSIPTTIDFRQHVDPACGSVLANPTEIHQIMMNLCVNAFHAMRDQGHGILSVDLRQESLEEADVGRMGFEVAPGNYVCLSVSDTGHGMDGKTQERIFEPYFTTKKKGEGTGMGLAMVHGIVKKCGGHIKVYSEPGKGSTFKVYLPEFRSELPGQIREEAIFTAPPPGGNESILLVDDEPTLVMVGTNILRGLGYRVEGATGSAEALAIFRDAPDAVDLVITDMTMPEMNGTELAEAMLQIRPDLPIIICSGYSEAIANVREQGLNIRATLQKPYLRRTLANLVRTTLNQQMMRG